MAFWSTFRVRMRPADPADPEFHLLEELAKPRACLTAGQVCCWVYHDHLGIREIVLSGHAEHSTCSRATTILVETVRRLDDSVAWMLTCGAAHFQVQAPGRKTQETLAAAVTDLRELAEETGLVTVLDRDWRALAAFRHQLRSHTGSAPPLVILPGAPGAESVADYVPVVPGNRPNGAPLEFRLEGWDYDCPEFQAVANLHLRNMRRELLRDALRRRLVYRSWLKEWTEPWIGRLHILPREQALAVTLKVPPPLEPPGQPEATLDAAAFLRELPRFLETGQSWPQALARDHDRLEYSPWNDAELDENHWPETISEVDYHRGTKRERPAEPTDPPFTWRERIRRQEPELLSHCLRYIRRMDQVIRPYEELETRHAGGAVSDAAGAAAAEIAVVGEISRRIVIETMIRGWPSFYLEDERDRAVFDAWARKRRPLAWAALARQARRQGVALEPLLEDNMIFDVRFDADLGCTIRPLTLVDDAVHAQIHGSRAGASAFIPLWTRRTSRPLDGGVLALGPGNSERARRLVEAADRCSRGPGASAAEAAHHLRLALACHPGEAGYLILQEWSRRLGRNTGPELQRARDLVEARELCLHHRYAEARPRIEAHLAAEPDPVPDAWVIAGLCELLHDRELSQILAELDAKAREHDALVARFKELAATVQKELEASRRGKARRGAGVEASLWERQNELEGLRRRIDAARGRCDELDEKARLLRESTESWIRRALEDPQAVSSRFPALARAAVQARSGLEATLPGAGHGAFPLISSKAFRDRYSEVQRVVRVRGALEIYHGLARIAHRIERGGSDQRDWPDGQELLGLSRSIWLPPAVKGGVEEVGRELGHGVGDRILTSTLVGALEDAMRSCLAEVKDRMSDVVVASAPFGESLATTIHVVQTIERRYRVALQILLQARVTLARAVAAPWTVLDRELTGLPEGAALRFEASTGTVLVEAADSRIPLLQAQGIGPDETRHLEAVLASPDLPARIYPLAPSLADGLLGVEIEPGRDWHVWRDAMELVTPELLHALSSFSYRACLLPDLAPSLTEAGRRMDERMERIVPRGKPDVDWSWSDPGSWRELLGQDARRTRNRSGRGALFSSPVSHGS